MKIVFYIFWGKQFGEGIFLGGGRLSKDRADD